MAIACGESSPNPIEPKGTGGASATAGTTGSTSNGGVSSVATSSTGSTVVVGSGGAATGTAGSGAGGSSAGGSGAGGSTTDGGSGADASVLEGGINAVPADYKGRPFAKLQIPGTIHLADYDLGGAGVAYCHGNANDCAAGIKMNDW